MVYDPTKAVNDMYADIGEFHYKFMLPSFGSFDIMPDSLVGFRERFLVEEATETIKAIRRGDYPEVLDGLIDLAYIALGTLFLMGAKRQELMIRRAKYTIQIINALEDGIKLNHDSAQYLIDLAYGCRDIAISLGYNFDEGWRRVHYCNMQKVKGDGVKGKRKSPWDVVKPEGWVKPELGDLV